MCSKWWHTAATYLSWFSNWPLFFSRPILGWKTSKRIASTLPNGWLESRNFQLRNKSTFFPRSHTSIMMLLALNPVGHFKICQKNDFTYAKIILVVKNDQYAKQQLLNHCIFLLVEAPHHKKKVCIQIPARVISCPDLKKLLTKTRDKIARYLDGVHWKGARNVEKDLRYRVFFLVSFPMLT